MINQIRINEIVNIWQMIHLQMKERNISPTKLSYNTEYSQDHIERGIRGEPIPITLPFLRGCIMAFGLTSGRTKLYEETVEDLSYEECLALLKPPPAMPPRQGDFWDYL